MAIITFTSDFGYKDHYVASVKAKMMSYNPNVKIIDIAHDIEPFNINHTAYILKSCFRDFPEGTVHLVSVNLHEHYPARFVAMKLEEHYFVGPDNGLFSLISDKQPVVVIEIKPDTLNNNYSPSFPTKSTLSQVASKLSNGISIYDLGVKTELKIKYNKQVPNVRPNKIVGQILHIDHYGNIITNISKELFDKEHQGREFEIVFSKEHIREISTSYEDVRDGGDIIVLFNSEGWLEIAIKNGKAYELLGINNQSMVSIKFLDPKVVPIKLEEGLF